MKLLKRLSFVLVLAVLFSSCSKDDDNKLEDSLMGTWKVTSQKYNGEAQELDVCELKTTVKFTESKVTSTEYEGENCAVEFSETDSYTRNGNTISITSEGETVNIEITKLTSTTLELTQVDEDNDVYVQTYAKQ